MSKSAKQTKQASLSGSTNSLKKTASSGTISKGRKMRDRAEVEKMNGMGSLGELQGRLSGKKVVLPASQTKVRCGLVTSLHAACCMLQAACCMLLLLLRLTTLRARCSQTSKVSGRPVTTAELTNALAKTL